MEFEEFPSVFNETGMLPAKVIFGHMVIRTFTRTFHLFLAHEMK